MGVDTILTAQSTDRVRFTVLADRTREDVGFLRCRHGKENTIRKYHCTFMPFVQLTFTGCPQILSHASQIAVVPEEVRAKVDAYGSGLLSKWTPQQTILAHPVRRGLYDAHFKEKAHMTFPGHRMVRYTLWCQQCSGSISTWGSYVSGPICRGVHCIR